MNSGVGGGDTAMKALKDAEFDQWYIFKGQAYLPPHPYMYKYPPPLILQMDGCRFKMPFST